MTPRPFVAVAWVLSLTALACHSTGAQAGRTLIRHDFTDSAEGWIVSGDTRPADAIFSRTGGHPGGRITGVDEALGETWYFLAPATVLQQAGRSCTEPSISSMAGKSSNTPTGNLSSR